MLRSTQEYRESLRAYSPRVFINGERVAAVADDPRLRPGINAVGVTYDFAARTEHADLMLAHGQGPDEGDDRAVNRMLHINRHAEDLLRKLEAVRLVCRESGCAQRYLAHDALNAIFQTTHVGKERDGTEYHDRFLHYLEDVQDRDLSLGIAMTDGKGERNLGPHQQPVKDAYVHVSERRADGIVIRGVKAIVTGAPYMHELLVMPCRAMTAEADDYAVCCAVPIDAAGPLRPESSPESSPSTRPAQKSSSFARLSSSRSSRRGTSEVLEPLPVWVDLRSRDRRSGPQRRACQPGTGQCRYHGPNCAKHSALHIKSSAFYA